jgi:quercetin dioxygenase-like cupin family protein
MYSKNFYPIGTSRNKIENDIKKEGFTPHLITNSPGYRYEPHQHPQTKLLLCVKGSMSITVDLERYSFEPGDKLIIPGNTPHSALVGPHGCTFYWSEKII